ncbi:MAG: hypothetical protein K8I04_03820 [Gammaproteobacteria bacterium]|nr:hypothetical protein [Gammaproteobacteria bacterium]
MRTIILGVDCSAVSVIARLHLSFYDSHAVPTRSTLARQAMLTIDSTANAPSFLVGDELLATAGEAADYVMIVVDPNDAEAVHDATKAGEAARKAGSYLVMALCSEPVAADRLDATVKSTVLHLLRAAVDSLVVVKSGSHPDYDRAGVTRVAYTLVAATLDHRVNLIGLDLGDLKEAVHGWAIATVTMVDLAKANTTGDTPGFDGRIDIASPLRGNPRGLFCSYGAAPDQLRLEDFESAGSAIQDALSIAYPMCDVTIAVACLGDGSLGHTAEVVACLAFNG